MPDSRLSLYPRDCRCDPKDSSDPAQRSNCRSPFPQAAQAFRAAIAADPAYYEAHHGLIRALRDAGRLEQSIAVALALVALTPHDALAHTALSICLQQAGHVPQAEAAAARARVLEWKIQLQSPPQESSLP